MTTRMNTISPSASQREPATGVWVEQQGAGGLHLPAPDSSLSTLNLQLSTRSKPTLIAELKHLNHRKTFQIVSASVRKKEDAEIDAIIAELRRRETK